MHRLSRFFVVGALALLATPAAAQVVRAGDDVPGQPGAVPVTATDGRTAKVPVYVPVRPDGTVIDPAGGGSGATASQIQGNAASGATDVGNPVKVGCEFNTTNPTVTNGQRVDVNCTNRGEVMTALSSSGVALGAGAATTSTLANTVTGIYSNSFNRVASGTNWYPVTGNTAGQQFVVSVADATTTSGVAPVVTSAVAGGQVVKAGPGNLFGLNVVSGASAGYVLLTNTTTVPADGAVTPLKCYVLPANSSLDLNLRAAPAFFSVGISVSFSTTGCFTKTASATAFISGDAK